jgi:hypothetical protein
MVNAMEEHSGYDSSALYGMDPMDEIVGPPTTPPLSIKLSNLAEYDSPVVYGKSKTVVLAKAFPTMATGALIASVKTLNEVREELGLDSMPPEHPNCLCINVPPRNCK